MKPTEDASASKDQRARLTPRIACGIALITGSILLLEISLTRYFSFKLWYHYAFMIISIALLGLSAASTALALNRQRLLRVQPRRILAYFALMYGVSIIVALPLLSLLSESWLGETESSTWRLLLIIASYWIVLFIPFFFAGATVSWAILTYARKISVLYALDLLGASLGCLFSVWLLSYFYPEQTLLLAAAIAIASSLLFFPSKQKQRSLFPPIAVACLLGAVIGAYDGDTLVGATTTPQKGLQRDLTAGGRLIASRPSMTGRVDAVETSLKRFAWGVGNNYQGTFPEEIALRIDGDAMTMIIRYDGDFSKWTFTDFLPGSLPYYLGKPKKALIIGPGGGMEVTNALGRGVQEVVGVEINGRIIEMVKDDFAEFSGRIYHDPRVRIIHSDGRNYVENTPEQYDLIQLTLVDSATAISSGALSISEDFLYTTEAFRAYIEALNNDGYLVLGRTHYETLWLLTLIHAATRGEDLNLADHIFIGKNPENVFGLVVAFKKTPFTDSEIERGISFLKQAKLNLVYAPRRIDDSDPEITKFLNHPDRDQFIRDYPEDIVPETDDMPFYFRSSKWSSLFGTYGGGKGNLLIILGVSIIFVSVFILTPLTITAREALRNNGRYLWFFAFIGMGFIILELTLMIKFTLFLGHPVRSLTVTLFALLFFCGIGSFCSRRIVDQGIRGRKTRLTALPLIIICILGVAYGIFLPGILSMWMGLSLPLRVSLSLLLIAPLGIMMGMPLPIGITLLESKERKLILWAWGLNGVASVIGSILCIVLAHLIGYQMLFFLSALCYLAAALCLVRSRPGYRIKHA